MELSILVAQIISIVYLSAGLGAIFSVDHYSRVVDDMFKNAALTYLTGFIALIKGVLIIALPKFVHQLSKPIFEGWGFRIFPYVAIFMGLLFGYFGFFS